MPYPSDTPRFPGVIGTFMGRDALSLAVSYLGLKSTDTVLLPVYTCQEVLRSFLDQTNVVFYDVLPDLTIDPDEISAKLVKCHAKMVLITNYFGFLQPYRREIKKICVDRGVPVIEDCAHSLLTSGSGDTGDLSTYSFRKILPLPDGGGLKVDPAAKPCVPEFYPAAYSNVLSVVAIAKSRLNIHTEMLSRARVAGSAKSMLPSIAAPRESGRTMRLSSFARARMANISFPEIIEKRRNDFKFWQDVVNGTDSLVSVCGDLPPDVCPLGFAVRTANRASIELNARTKGIKLSVHWRLDPGLGPECRTSHELSSEMLTLPVYPDLREEDRGVLADLLTARSQ
jgi:hypothetical protein